MRKDLLLFFFILFGFGTSLWAQCPGWHNPTSFVTNNHLFFYSGKYLSSVPSAAYATIGVGPEYYTNEALIPAENLSTITSTQGCSSLNLSDGTNLFVIKGAGTDPNTNNAISFLPSDINGIPHLDHDGQPYTQSIRVGTECTYGAAVLYYQMNITPQNNLLTFWYAPIVETPTSHNQYENSAVILRVTKQQGNDWVLLDECYEFTASGQPATASFPQGLIEGVNGWHHINNGGYTDIWYKEWTKMIIPLDQHIFETIRVEVYMSSCVYNAHYAYCYIAGDSEPVQISGSGNSLDYLTVNDTLYAPEDMSSYTWYRSASGFDIQDHLFDLRYLDTTPTGLVRTVLYGSENNDTISWERCENGDQRQYQVQVNDFISNNDSKSGNALDVQSFMCKMVTYLDSTKPIESFAFIRVVNNLVIFDSLIYSDSSKIVVIGHAEGITHVTIPETVVAIADSAFYGCGSLRSVTIPNTVIHIGDYAFAHCYGLTGTFNIPELVTNIGNGAFYGCTGLTHVYVGRAVDSIRSNAFSECSGLQVLFLDHSLHYVGQQAFYNCINLDSIYSYNFIPPTIESSDAFGNVSRMTPIVVPSGSLNDYSNAPVWSEFFNIIEEEGVPQGICLAEGDGVTLSIHNGSFVIKGAEGHRVTISDALGRIHYRGTATAAVTVTVSHAGIYLLQIDDHLAHRIAMTR